LTFSPYVVCVADTETQPAGNRPPRVCHNIHALDDRTGDATERHASIPVRDDLCGWKFRSVLFCERTTGTVLEYSCCASPPVVQCSMKSNRHRADRGVDADAVRWLSFLDPIRLQRRMDGTSVMRRRRLDE
jgi:hypothetical protein